MRLLGTKAMGVRLPIISSGDNLSDIVTNSVVEAITEENIKLQSSDIIGITEAIVAKAQGNFAELEHIAADIAEKFPDGEVGLVFPILSRNRFLNILKGIAKGAKKVYVLLKYPDDEVGNPIMDINDLDIVDDTIKTPASSEDFIKITDNYLHPFTGINYVSLYESVGDNVEVYVSKDPRDILKFTKNVLVAEIHSRFTTKARLLKAGAKNVYTLSDILSKPVNGSGYNPSYGVLGSNMSTDSRLKLFPRDCEQFVSEVRKKIYDKTGVMLEVLVYGDGAFKDPAAGIWELADPVVSPGYTERLSQRPNELKLKFIADTVFKDLNGHEKQKAITEMIKDKNNNENLYSEGTTPRKYADLIGSLCDLISGSGDKGTPVILIQGYFDDYASK